MPGQYRQESVKVRRLHLRLYLRTPRSQAFRQEVENMSVPGHVSTAKSSPLSVTLRQCSPPAASLTRHMTCCQLTNDQARLDGHLMERSKI